MNQAIEIVQIEKTALEKLLYRVAKQASADALAERAEQEEMLNIAQLCERTGLTRHTFAALRDKHRLKCTGGKYSMAEVRNAINA